MSKTSIVEQIQKYRKVLLVESVQPSSDTIKKAVMQAKSEAQRAAPNLSPMYVKLINFVADKLGKKFMDNPQELENLLATSIADGGGQMFVDYIDQCCGRTIDHVSDQDELIGDAGTMYDIVVDAFYTAHGLPGGFSF